MHQDQRTLAFLKHLQLPIWQMKGSHLGVPSRFVEAETQVADTKPLQAPSSLVEKPPAQEALARPPASARLEMPVDEKAEQKAQTLSHASPETTQAVAPFQVLAVHIGKGLALGADIPLSVGLEMNDQALLEKLVQAIRKHFGLPSAPIEYQFFRWPPATGLGSGLDQSQFVQAMLKGFLHKVVQKQQSSWIILGDIIAEQCFPHVDANEQEPLHILHPRAGQDILIGPGLSALHADKHQKAALWKTIQQIKPLAS